MKISLVALFALFLILLLVFSSVRFNVRQNCWKELNGCRVVTVQLHNSSSAILKSARLFADHDCPKCLTSIGQIIQNAEYRWSEAGRSNKNLVTNSESDWAEINIIYKNEKSAVLYVNDIGRCAIQDSNGDICSFLADGRSKLFNDIQDILRNKIQD